MKNKKIQTRLLSLVLIIIFALALGGCSSSKDVPTQDTTTAEETTAPEETTTSPPQGITVNQIPFEVVQKDALDSQLQSDIDQLIPNRGYYYWIDDQGVYTLFVGLGIKSTGGYSIEIASIEDNEGKTNVLVKESSPAADAVVTEAITYPYSIVKLQGVTDQFTVKNEALESFVFLNEIIREVLSIEGIYEGQIDNNSIEVSAGDTFMVFRNFDLGPMLSGISEGDPVKITYTVNSENQNLLLSLEGLQ